MKKKLLAIILSLALLISAFPPLGTVATASGSFVTVLQDGEAVSAISVPENEERLLTGSVSGIAAESYHWQIKIKNADIWVNIDGLTSPECAVSYALVGSMMDGSGMAYLRLAVTASGSIYTSNPVAVTITEPEPGVEAEELEPMALEDLDVTVIDLSPTEAPSEPTEAPSEPTEAPSEPTEAPSQPTEAPSEPTEAPSEPTEAPSEPTEAPSEPTEALSEPTEAPSEPTEAPSQPTEAASEPTEAASEPTEAVEPITEPEIETTQAPETEEPGESIPEAESLAVNTMSQQTWSAQPLVMASSQQEYQLVMLSSIEEPDTDESETPSDPVAPIADGEEEGGDGDGDGGTTTPSTPSGSTKTYDVIVQFSYMDGTQVEQNWMARVAEGQDLNYVLTFNKVAGYEAYYNKNKDDYYTADEKIQLGSDGKYAFNIDIKEISQDETFVIRFRPAAVEYKVEHYLQNFDGSGYTLSYAETKSGTTNTLVPEDLGAGSDQTVGYTAQSYDRVAIAADGTTVIKIYYLINYYLINFQLGEGAYGVEPVYVRYQTKLNIPKPQHPGYTFNGWELLTVNEAEATAEQKIQYAIGTNNQLTVPAASLTYQALWNTGSSSYTVVYWRESESKYGDNNIKYEYWGSELIGGTYTEDGLLLNNQVKSGDSIDIGKYTSIPADIATTDAGLNETPFFHYNATKTADENPTAITVSGDGTTVVNIYFDRNTYNLKFYYAASSGTQNYVIGGTTYYFGASATSNTNNDIALFGAQFTNNWTSMKVDNPVGTVNAKPQLNENGQGKNYVEGQVTSGNYTLYYIAFQAKYGMDITSMWPTDVFNSVTRTSTGNNGSWTSKTAFVSAWNGEHNVYYSQTHGNQTIKGKYDKLDANLLWANGRDGISGYADESEKTLDSLTSDGGTVAYLCFWENGANVTWSVPELYRYNIWLECVDQTNHPEEGAKQMAFSGSTKWYYRSERYNTVDDSDVNNQTTPPMYGFTSVGRDSTHLSSGSVTDDTHYNSSEYADGYDVNFYYDRNKYILQFNNMGEILPVQDGSGGYLDHQEVRYGVSLYNEAGYDISVLEGYNGESYYPSSLPQGGYEFEGWYSYSTFEASTKFEFDKNSTMPASPLVLYAKWVPKKFKVRIYNDKATMESGGDTLWSLKDGDGNVIRNYTEVEYDGYAPTPSEKYTQDTSVLHFVGWFYEDSTSLDANGNPIEKAFDFDNMKVTTDMDIYGKWTSSTLRTYIIRYVLEGTDTEIAECSTGTEVIGGTVTVRPKTGTQLNEDYRTNYFPEGDSHSITIKETYTEDDEVTVDEQGRVIYTIAYKEAKSVPYKVRYVVRNADGTEKEIADSVEYTSNQYSIVTEVFKYIPNYIPDSYSKRLMVALDKNGEPDEEHNVITFVYSENTENEAPYRVEVYVQGEADNGYVLLPEETIDAVGTYNNQITVEVKQRTGFTFKENDTKVTSGTSKVNYTYEDGKISATLPQEGMLIQLYYDRREFTYKVQYLKYKEQDDTSTEEMALAPEKTGTARYGATVVENSITIDGYKLVSDSTKDATILNGDTVIEFRYQETDTAIKYVAKDEQGTLAVGTTTGVFEVTETVSTVTGTAQGATPTANGGYHFVGWYLNEACTIPVNEGWVDATTNKLTPQKEAETGTNDYDNIDSYFVERTYYALFERNHADLTISTTFPLNNNYRQVDGSQTFVFQITGTGSNAGISLTVTLHERESKTITDLPTGTYTVTELGSSAWRYGADSATKSVDVKPNQANSVSFVETRNQLYWLDGNATKAVNSFAPINDPEQEGGA